MRPYEDRMDPGNGEAYHTGLECITPDCHNKAGTWWSPLWCFECNVKRIKKIHSQLDKLLKGEPVPTAPNGGPLE